MKVRVELILHDSFFSTCCFNNHKISPSSLYPFLSHFFLKHFSFVSLFLSLLPFLSVSFVCCPFLLSTHFHLFTSFIPPSTLCFCSFSFILHLLIFFFPSYSLSLSSSFLIERKKNLEQKGFSLRRKKNSVEKKEA